MPISFTSKSHGSIPVGFFNIETDMLLMDRIFLFSTDFCAWVIEWAGTVDLNLDQKRVYVIQDTDLIGNLAGAIYGFESTGFIGEVYKKFPFPERQSGFKQKPHGPKNRKTIEKTIQSFAVQLTIPIAFSKAHQTISLGDYVFSAKVFQKILRYVKEGGMPGWLDSKPPDYVSRMTSRVAVSRHWFFNPNIS